MFEKEAVERVSGSWERAEYANKCMREIETRMASSINLNGQGKITPKTVFNIRAFIQSCAYRIHTLSNGSTSMWNNGNAISSITLSRAVLETVVTFYDFYHNLSQLEAKMDRAGIKELVLKRMNAIRIEEWVKQFEEYKSVNVITMIGRMNKEYPGISDNYEKLSEFSHPNCLGTLMAFGKLDTNNGLWSFDRNNQNSEKTFDVVYSGLHTIGFFIISLNELENMMPRISEIFNPDHNQRI
ncbi:hypothetical protein M2352_001796 [Azospirillum fermentarium]|uniref:hypothetical protein n=1 Tax=Azospirillum fermentarium TaxID=1233114 RepID=UPI002226499A|nr:hypothetical protein [Azospirillum fermentarium]MCW2246205.1 hypothetical protein [Azospirillum fermentarium]